MTLKYATKDISINNAKAFLHSLNADEDGRSSKKSTILYMALGKTQIMINI